MSVNTSEISNVNKNKWRTTPSGTEGITFVYVDCTFGSDAYGCGTRQRPYKTVLYAAKGGNSKEMTKTDESEGTNTIPSTIVFRGLCHDDIPGDHTMEIRGDYMGAAVFDGGNVNNICFTGLRNIIVRNAGVNQTRLGTVTAYSGSTQGYFAGCGRAIYANYAGTANYGSGATASPVYFDNVCLFRGEMGGANNVGNIYANIKKNHETCGITFGKFGSSSAFTNNTFYGIDIKQRSYTKTVNSTAYSSKWDVLCKVDMLLDHLDTFEECLFSSDCRWFYTDKTTNELTQIFWSYNEEETETAVIEETTSNEDYCWTSGGACKYVTKTITVEGASITSIYYAINYLYNAGRMTYSYNPATYLKNSIFSTRTAAEIMNDPDKGDYSMAYVDSSSEYYNECMISDTTNRGALTMGFCINVFNSSNKKLNCWDNATKTGCLKISNNTLCIDTTSSSNLGSILSKVIKINPSKVTFDGLYSIIVNKYLYGWQVNNIKNYTNIVKEDGILDKGLYLLKSSTNDASASITYGSNTYLADEIITVDEDTSDVTYGLSSSTYLIKVLDRNIPDVIFCRCAAQARHRKKSGTSSVEGDKLEQNYIYINNTGKTVVLKGGRELVAGESYCSGGSETFYIKEDLDNNNYYLDAVFCNDPTDTNNYDIWTPMQQYGKYGVAKNGSTILTSTIPNPDDDENPLAIVPKSYGNYYIYNNSSSPDVDTYSILDQVYIQLGIFVTKVSEYNVS